MSFSVRRALLDTAACALYPLYSLYAGTVPFRVAGAEWNPHHKEKDVNTIYVFWHSKTFLLLPLCRDLNISVLTLLDWKNVLYDKICRLFGYKTVPVTSFESAAMELKNILEGGRSVALALDGPKGPAGKAKRGALHLARTTKRPIVAVRIEYAKSFRLGWRWDRYEIPLPFFRASFSNCGPFNVDDTNLEEIEARLLAHLGEP